MGRPSKLWYRSYGKGRGAWVSKVDGTQETFATGPKEATRAEAKKAFHQFLAERGKATVEGISLQVLVDLFLETTEKHLRPLTLEFYRRHCLGFWRHVGVIAAADVKPLHLTSWLAAHDWGPTTRHGAITAVKRMYRWAKKEGHLDGNPLADVEKPRPRRREEIMTEGQVNEILDATRDQAFKDLLALAALTGSRPSELLAIEAHHLDLADGIIALESKTGARVIHLTPEAVALCRVLVARWPEGPILRNRDGNPWNRNATKSRFARLRAKLGLGKEATLESFRHAFATDGLEAGVPIKTMAELMGHASTAMIDRHYSKLHRRRAHLQEAVAQVRPPGALTSRSETASHPGDPEAPSG